MSNPLESPAPTVDMADIEAAMDKLVGDKKPNTVAVPLGELRPSVSIPMGMSSGMSPGGGMSIPGRTSILSSPYSDRMPSRPKWGKMFGGGSRGPSREFSRPRSSSGEYRHILGPLFGLLMSLGIFTIGFLAWVDGARGLGLDWFVVFPGIGVFAILYFLLSVYEGWYLTSWENFVADPLGGTVWVCVILVDIGLVAGGVMKILALIHISLFGIPVSFRAEDWTTRVTIGVVAEMVAFLAEPLMRKFFFELKGAIGR